MNDIVSIIIPLYNSELYICETIESCICQTYSNIEIIIVDDCSTDKSFDIVKSTFYDYSNIIMIHNQRNIGLIKTINIGISVSSGQYVIVLGNDDLLEKNHVEIMHSVLAGNNHSFVYCGSKYIDENGIVFGESKTINIKGNELLFSKFNIVNSCGLMIRQEILNKIGNYPEYLGFRNYGEWYLWILLHSYSEGIYTDKIQSRYRIHKNNMTNTFYSRENLKSTSDYNIKCMTLAYHHFKLSVLDRINLIVFRLIYALKLRYHLLVK